MKKSKKHKSGTSNFWAKYDKVYSAVQFAQNNDERWRIEKGDLVSDFLDLIDLIPEDKKG